VAGIGNPASKKISDVSTDSTTEDQLNDRGSNHHSRKRKDYDDQKSDYVAMALTTLMAQPTKTRMVTDTPVMMTIMATKTIGTAMIPAEMLEPQTTMGMMATATAVDVAIRDEMEARSPILQPPKPHSKNKLPSCKLQYPR
jgi:hypothetical protein